MDLNQSTKLSLEQIEIKKDRYYKRNYIALCMEGFFFSCACSMFSSENVLPAYVSNITNRPWAIALISILYYGFSYGFNIFSCPIGVGTKSPKWTSVLICMLQRVGFFLIFLSTFSITKSTDLALIMFFVAFGGHSISVGLSLPLFSQMVSVSIHKNVSNFFGSYQLVGMVGSVLGSIVFTKLLKTYSFPKNYRVLFLIGLAFALIATCVVSFGVKEVIDDRVPEKINVKDVFPIGYKLMKENPEFLHFTIVRIIVALAEFAIPYYIVVLAAKQGAPEGFEGVLTTIYLIAKMINSVVAGKIGDKCGPLAILGISCGFGVLAALFAIIATDWQLAIVAYIMVAFAVNGVVVANYSATAIYSNNQSQYVPICSATMSLLCAPLYIVAAFGGATLARLFSNSAMFAMALIAYLCGAILSWLYYKRDRKSIMLK